MSPIVIVTGANRGVGLGIVNRLSASTTPYTLYLTSRSGNDLPESKDPHTFHPVKLDISDPSAIEDFAARVEKEQGKGSVDALINNAGQNVDYSMGYNAESVKTTMTTNFYGTKNMCNAFLPLIKSQGRIVNVASVAGHLNGYSASAKAKIEDSATSLDKVDALVQEYEGLLEQGKETEAGFKNSAYCISKVFVVAFTKALAAAEKDKYINCCCPGWVDTDMGNLIGDAPKHIEDGAKIPVRCAVGDIKGSTGQFWENKSVTDTGDGQISVWQTDRTVRERIV